MSALLHRRWTFLGQIGLTLILLTACSDASTPDLSPAAPAATRLRYVTLPADATATPTPFRPLAGTDTPPPSLTPAVTAPLPVEVTPSPSSTPDFNLLLPAAWTPPAFYVPAGVPTPMPLLTDNEMVTFLLLGSDMRLGTPFRTDTMIFVAIRPKSGQVTLVSIPRDLWVYIPGWEMQRINTAYVHGSASAPDGGETLLKNTVLYNLGLRVDYIAIVDFDGFRRIVDTLGGIDVPVACPYTDWRLKSPELDPQVEENWELYTVQPGLVHMDGDLALWYARARKKSSDYDRSRRQQEVLRAIYAKGLQLGVVTKIPQLYGALRNSLRTDVDLKTLLALAPLAWHVTNADIRSYYIVPPLVNGWITPGGAWVALPDGAAIRAMLERALSPQRQGREEDSVLIEVWNGTTYEGWDRLAAERLNYAGYETRLERADRRDYAQTWLYDVTTDQDTARAARILNVLGLSSAARIAAPGYRQGVSYVLIVGADYQPCFQPQTLQP
jgi:LCP family protein required for cell wall assembly